MVVYEAARFCRAGGTYWPPAADGALQPYSNSSYFRVRDMTTGAVLGNVQGSQCFAYGSMVVDPVLQRAWVFGSERDLCKNPGLGGCSQNCSACKPYWQGRSSVGNGVRAWWSDDLATWHTAAAPAVMFPDYPFNTDVTPVVNKSLLTRADGGRAIVDIAALRPADLANAEPLNFVMVSENGRVVTHSHPDRNLSTGWSFFGSCGRTDTDGVGEDAVAAGTTPSTACAHPPCDQPDCGFGACPAVHYGEEDGFFYVISGGREISLARTRDLTTWEHAPPLVTYDRSEDLKLSPYMNAAAQAEGAAPATPEHAAAAKQMRTVLAHPECWESFVNDADMCCGGPLTAPGAPTDKAFVLYSPSSQGRPALKNCSTSLAHMATDFNGVATADVSLTKLLSSRFKAKIAGPGDAGESQTDGAHTLGEATAPKAPAAAVASQHRQRGHTTYSGAEVDVEDFGAKADGKTECSAAFTAALRNVSTRGGGIVHARSHGVYVVNPIELQNDTVLQIAAGTFVNATHNCPGKDFPTFMLPRPAQCGGTGSTKAYPPCGTVLFAANVHNFSVRGGGSLDGGGKVFDAPPYKHPKGALLQFWMSSHVRKRVLYTRRHCWGCTIITPFDRGAGHRTSVLLGIALCCRIHADVRNHADAY